MGRRKTEEQKPWVSVAELPRTAVHPHYGKVNEVLQRAGLDRRFERLCKKYPKPAMDRPSVSFGCCSSTCG